MTLPINGESVTVTVSDKVYMSLRTKSAREAKDRFQIALNRLAVIQHRSATPPQVRSKTLNLLGFIFFVRVHDRRRPRTLHEQQYAFQINEV